MPWINCQDSQNTWCRQFTYIEWMMYVYICVWIGRAERGTKMLWREVSWGMYACICSCVRESAYSYLSKYVWDKKERKKKEKKESLYVSAKDMAVHVSIVYGYEYYTCEPERRLAHFLFAGRKFLQFLSTTHGHVLKMNRIPITPPDSHESCLCYSSCLKMH